MALSLAHLCIIGSERALRLISPANEEARDSYIPSIMGFLSFSARFTVPSAAVRFVSAVCVASSFSFIKIWHGYRVS